MSTMDNPSFGRAGRPRKIELSDIFLWNPQIEYEIAGLSQSELFGDSNPELLALLQDINRKRPISINRMNKVLPSALEMVEFPFVEEFRVGLNGGISFLNNWGPWKYYLYSLHIKPNDRELPKLPLLERHLIDVEEELKGPTLAWRKKDMKKCVDLLEQSHILADYLWPEVLCQLRNAHTDKEVLGARGMVMLEIMLSFIANLDAQWQIEGFSNQSICENLFPNFDLEEPVHPNKLYFEWLERFSNEKSLASKMHQIDKHEKDTDIASTKRQIRRWKSGKGFPSKDVLIDLFTGIYGDKSWDKNSKENRDAKLSWEMAMITKRINFLMPILSPLSQADTTTFPFDYKTVQSWRKNRYQHWYSCWLSRLVETA